MPRLLTIQNAPAQVSADQPIAALLLIFVVIVLTSGVLALLLIVRAKLRRGIPKKHTPEPEILNAWEESGKRMQPPPSEDDDSERDDDNNDDDDDDDGEPTPPLPVSPETAASI
jgi:hypothetical protein